MKAYYFLRKDMTSGSGHEEPWKVGEARRIEGHIALCERGYHSSPTPAMALEYAPGSMLCLVDVSKPVQKDSDKQVSRKRTLLAAINVEHILYDLACRFAEDVLQIFEKEYPEDSRPRVAIETKRRWLKGQASDEELDAARAAARAKYTIWINEALLAELDKAMATSAVGAS